MSSRKLRASVAAAGVFLAIVGLSGCTLGDSKSGIGLTQGAGAVKPAVGECWTLTYDHLESWADWKGSQPIACSSPHQAYTYAVTALPGGQPDSWQTTGTDPHMRPEVQDAAGAACDAERAKHLPNMTSDDVLIVPAFYVASLSAWKAGARWVRCDVSTIAFGSAVEAPKLADMQLFESIVNQSGASYKYCVDAPGSNSNTGPFSTHTGTFADCTLHPQWSISARAVIPGDAATPYPGKATLDEFSREHCGHGKVLWPIYPTAQQWATGARAFECWEEYRGPVVYTTS